MWSPSFMMSPPAVASRSPGPRPRSGIFGRPTLFFQPDLFSEAIAAVWQQDRFPARVLTPGKGYKVDSFDTMLPDREAVPRTIWQALAASRGRQPVAGGGRDGRCEPMTLESWLHFFHLLGSMIWVGGTLVLSLVAGRVLSRQDPKEIREFAATLSFVGLRVQAPAVIALFVGTRRERATGCCTSLHPAAFAPMLRDEGCRLSSSLEVQLREDRADVVLDRLVREEDIGRDLLVRLSLGDEHQDLPFLRGERRQFVVGAPCGDPPDALQHPLRDGRIEQRLTAPDGFESRDQIARADLLEEVARSAGNDGRQDRLVVRERGEHDHPRSRQLITDRAARL